MLECSQMQTTHRVMSSCSLRWWVANIISTSAQQNSYYKLVITIFPNSQLTFQAFLLMLLDLIFYMFVRGRYKHFLNCVQCSKTFQLLPLQKHFDKLSIIQKIVTEKKQNVQSKSPNKQVLAVSSCNSFPRFLSHKQAGDQQALPLLRSRAGSQIMPHSLSAHSFLPQATDNKYFRFCSRTEMYSQSFGFAHFSNNHNLGEARTICQRCNQESKLQPRSFFSAELKLCHKLQTIATSILYFIK